MTGFNNNYSQCSSMNSFHLLLSHSVFINFTFNLIFLKSFWPLIVETILQMLSDKHTSLCFLHLGVRTSNLGVLKSDISDLSADSRQILSFFELADGGSISDVMILPWIVSLAWWHSLPTIVCMYGHSYFYGLTLFE